MLSVKTPEEVFDILRMNVNGPIPAETVPLSEACGRTLKEAFTADEYVPDFNRSTVDGFAVRAADTFGCSESIPAILPLMGEIRMGDAAGLTLEAGSCAAVATGGDVPDGADAVVMLEHTEDYGDGTIGITKPVAPGNNMIFRGDDVFPGKTILPAGHTLTPHDMGALAALGVLKAAVCRKPVVGIISTGDELVEIGENPARGQIRDVNSSLLAALIRESGGEAVSYGIVRDDEEKLRDALDEALAVCDMVLISGGSSVGMKDATARVIEARGKLLFHGIAMKPGKPTILGIIDEKPVFGLPGHPVAAYFISQLFVREALRRLGGSLRKPYPVSARLTEAVSSNHGRAEYLGVRLEEGGDGPAAVPIRGKSGLITSLAGSDGYISIPRDCEGFPRGAAVPVYLWGC